MNASFWRKSLIFSLDVYRVVVARKKKGKREVLAVYEMKEPEQIAEYCNNRII